MRFRQIHLDFHTSEHIPGIGSRFDAKTFGEAFRAAHVDSVTIFSKCHHGHNYHPTQIGRMHPHLDFDLTRAQLDALHAVGIKAPIYTTATWDEYAAHKHPEWRTILPDGKLAEHRSGPDETVGWAFMDFGTPYLDYLNSQVEELLEQFPDGDGVFMDISFQLPSISEYAKAGMEADGLDWTDPDHRNIHTARVADRYYTRITDTVRNFDTKMPLFFNSGHMRRGVRQHYLDHYTHLELESLPTAHWGYEHFPLSARYAEVVGMPFLGMTGKFHTLWGEVGGYKKPEALVYECGAMIAQGARCSIGDHLHPTGMIDKTTMDTIRDAYAWVEAREDWCAGTTNIAEIALLSLEAAARPSMVGLPGKSVAADEGAVRVLLESQLLFDVVDIETDFDGYKLLILPDAVLVDDDLKAKIDAFTAVGGRVLLTGKSGIGEDGNVFDTGAVWQGTSANAGGDYLLPIDNLRASFVNDPLFMYGPAEKLELTDGTGLGAVYEPYFDRTPRHYSGHINAPSKPDPETHVAGSEKGAFVHCAFPIFSLYHKVGAVAMLEFADNLIRHALGHDPRIETTLPRSGRATLRHHDARNSEVLHLLCAHPVLRGEVRGNPVQPIQDLIPLHDIEISLAGSAPSTVRLVPEGTELPMTQSGERTVFTVPKVIGHQMVEVVRS
ncbi:beta-galactosidase trimerization domain-containing protein [Rhodobacteraceae bacterium]|nr:beta-galactosidase trimerization domain-containing protein [Paracoccaceae bacterium]